MHLSLIKYSILIVSLSLSNALGSEEAIKDDSKLVILNSVDHKKIPRIPEGEQLIQKEEVEAELYIDKGGSISSSISLEQLPQEILFNILYFVEARDLQSISLLNYFFCNIVHDQIFLRNYLQLISCNAEEFNNLFVPENDKIIPTYRSLMLAVLSGDFCGAFNEKYFSLKENIRDEKEKKAHKVNFSGLKYKFLPKEISLLINVQTLFLNNNELRAIPEEFGFLHQLVELSLNNNKIRIFPVSLLQITSLRKLSMAGNLIHTIPLEIQFLTNLEELNLGSNRIQHFLPEVLMLPNLSKVYIDCNNIDKLPDQLAFQSKLTYINILENPISNYSQVVSLYLKQGIELIF